MKVQNTDEEPVYFDHDDHNALHEILDTQHKKAQYMKNRGDNRLFQILRIIDDFADSPDFTRKS
ncbi:MAG: hypothetical protein ACKPKO_29630, partial [Candidatus Fonsibacter sp.]